MFDIKDIKVGLWDQRKNLMLINRKRNENYVYHTKLGLQSNLSINATQRIQGIWVLWTVVFLGRFYVQHTFLLKLNGDNIGDHYRQVVFTERGLLAKTGSTVFKFARIKSLFFLVLEMPCLLIFI